MAKLTSKNLDLLKIYETVEIVQARKSSSVYLSSVNIRFLRVVIREGKGGIIIYFLPVSHYKNLVKFKRVADVSKYARKHGLSKLDFDSSLSIEELLSNFSIYKARFEAKQKKAEMTESAELLEDVTPVTNTPVTSSPSCSAPKPVTRGQGIFFDKNNNEIPHDKLLFCDTETTSLSKTGEICEIAITDYYGNVLLDTLVKPVYKIKQKAQSIHGITNVDVANAPSFADIFNQLKQIVLNKHIIFYNAEFDTRMICQSADIAFSDSEYLNISLDWRSLFGFLNAPPVHCLMEWYAKYWGEYNTYHGNYRWQSLVKACKQQEIDTDDIPNHRALGDVTKTLRLYKHLEEVNRC